MDAIEDELRQRLAVVDERIDRIGIRFTAGFGSESDRDGWLAWLRDLEARRSEILQGGATRGGQRDAAD